jgi:hypothetical protein
LADYIIRPAFLTAYKAAFATLNKDYSAGEEAYDKAYDTLNRLFFPYLGETEEHREQWIKLVHAFFSETQGGFWYVNKDFKEKDISKLKDDSASLIQHFAQIKTTKFLQGGSSIDTVDLFTKLQPDLVNLIKASPGMVTPLRTLTLNSHAKWQAVNNSASQIEESVLTDHFNSMYNQMTGWLLDFYKGEPLYSKNGATVAKVKKLITDGSVLKHINLLLAQGVDSKTGVDNSVLKATKFPAKDFLTEFENRFVFESAAYSDLKPSQVLLSLVEKPGGPVQPTPGNVLASQSATSAPTGSAEPVVKSTDLNTDGIADNLQDGNQPEVTVTANRNQPKLPETQSTTEKPVAPKVENQTTQTLNTQVGDQTVQNVTNQSSVQNTTVNNPAQPLTGSDVLSAASVEPISNEAARSQLYISLQGANWKESLKLRTELLKLDEAKQAQMAQAFAKDPGALPNIIAVLNGERRKFMVETEEKKTKTKEEKLEKSKRILEEAELKKKESTITIEKPSVMVAGNPDQTESPDLDKAEPDDQMTKTETKSPVADLVKTESKNLLKGDQANSIINPVNPTVTAVDKLGQTIVNTSTNTATAINKAVSNIKMPESSTVNNSNSITENNSNPVNLNPAQPDPAKNMDGSANQDANTGSGLSEYYLHAIYDALVGQGIKIRV